MQNGMNKQMGNRFGGLLVWSLVMTMGVFQAQAMADNTSDTSPSRQCFSDAKQAYAYLLRQQNAPTASEVMPININTASEAELTTLDGIGSSKAQAIILYRETMGQFETVDDLANVKGIGGKTLQNNRARLRVN